MLVSLASHDLDLCARTVKVLAADCNGEVLAALASTLRNRIIVSWRRDTPSPLDVCRALLIEATGNPVPQLCNAPASSDIEWCRAMAVNCLVWSGDLADPTKGATSCHRHDVQAPWAARRAATALIGSYIFLR
jgi:hypothetical protein